MCDRFCSDDGEGSRSFWKSSEAWERAQANEWELWSAAPDRARALDQQAVELYKVDHRAALGLFQEAAEAGSVWSMEKVGWYYDRGIADVVDFGLAREYYSRAVCAGSQTAIVSYAKLLERHGKHDDWPSALQIGVVADYAPAYFWLAWFRCKHSRKRKTFMEAKPLLEYAAGKGHPGARYTLAVWMAFGRFGLRQIPAGLRLLRHNAEQDRESRRAPQSVPESDEKLAA